MSSEPALQSPFYSLDIEDSVALVTLTRAERMNALHPAAHHALSALFDHLPDIPGVRAVIVTGAGEKAFCAGYDLRDSIETGVMEIAAKGFGGLTSRTDYPLPIIAAVNGVAMGGGFEMALACDIIVASANASFALPEPKVGWVALAGGVQRLPRAIGIKRALAMILTGKSVSADEGERLGFVNEVVAAEDLLTAARRWAADIAACGPLAIRCCKEVAYASMDMDLAAALDVDHFPTVAPMLDSADSIEGRQAFLERRKPVWTGS